MVNDVLIVEIYRVVVMLYIIFFVEGFLWIILTFRDSFFRWVLINEDSEI